MSDREQYFRKFPLIPYNGVPSINILRRVDFNNNVKNFFTAFYSFNIQSGERIETIAHDYYEDVDLDWLIYHANDIVDPYFGVPLDYQDFEEFLKSKYGSVDRSKTIVITYRSNHEDDNSIIPVLGSNGYNNLPGARKKYWEPVYNAENLAGYERKSEDIYISTNRIISFSLATSLDTPLTVGENVIASNGAKATVASCTADYLVLKHINGDWSTATSNFSLTGKDSNITATVDYTTYTLIRHVIPEAEQIYFSQYSAYDFELDLNEKKRDISLVDGIYAEDINIQLDKLMK